MNPSEKSRLSRVWIIVIAAIMVEALSIVQAERMRNMILDQLNSRSHLVLASRANEIGHALDLVETTMQENIWEVRRSLAHPDSVFQAIVYLIDDSPHILGGCLAFIPDYYPSKGRLFEPYGQKTNGAILVRQIEGPDHDYTQNEAFQKAIHAPGPMWSEPYRYGPDSLSITTYYYPVKDEQGRVVAACGLDLDLSWLGDTLNTQQPFPSSFGLLLTREGKLVTGPSEDRIPAAQVQEALDILNGTLPQSANPAIDIKTLSMNRAPYWQVVQVYQTSEALAPLHRMRIYQMFFILLGLAILAFMINRYAHNENKLHRASEEQARLGGELAVARNIQQQMLPETFPPFVYGFLEPAREVGGDLYDFIIRDGKFFFCIGDVSGKGVPSAMLMSVAHSLFRIVSQKEESPSHILQALNRQICQGNDSNMFLTFFVGCLDLYSGVLNFGNAGHDKPFVLSDGKIELLQTVPNLPLGIFPDTHFEEQNCTLAPGTILFMYTDGLTEAKNTDRKEFTREGVQKVLHEFLATDPEAPLETLVTSMNDAAHRFAGDAPQSDDLTMLALRFAPGELLREEIHLTNDESETTRLGTFVKDFFGKLELDNKTASGMRLALEEAVVNVIKYAYPAGEKGDILVQADSNREEVRFTIVDSGMPFDPTAVLEADTTLDAHNRPIGGLGILLSRKLTDSISYSRRNEQNILTLTKSIL